MKVLYLSAEATPLVKVGGLGDVAGELPRALSQRGLDVRLALPHYPSIPESLLDIDRRIDFEVETLQGRIPAVILELRLCGVRVILIGGEPIEADEVIYGTAEADTTKFTFFSIAALQACVALDWAPDIIHANDWHTAAAVVWLKANRSDPFWRSSRSVFTIHNIGYMGGEAGDSWGAYGLDVVGEPALQEEFQQLPLPNALVAADNLSTVSPMYAQEIQTPAFGDGLDALLRGREEKLRGILNGINLDVWNPETDDEIAQPFSITNLSGRKENKEALERMAELPTGSDAPVIGMVTRLDQQKGVDLALDAFALMIEDGLHVVLLGTGDPELEARAREFEATYPNRFRAFIEFNQSLARKIYAGSDLFLIPSRYEPCGLTQMIAMRYGSVPIVRATGGLKDTVVDTESSSEGTGFVFEHMDPSDAAETIQRAIRTYGRHPEWEQLQIRCLKQDFSWGQSARRYEEMYAEIVHQE
jgi:starch synthase